MTPSQYYFNLVTAQCSNNILLLLDSYYLMLLHFVLVSIHFIHDDSLSKLIHIFSFNNELIQVVTDFWNVHILYLRDIINI